MHYPCMLPCKGLHNVERAVGINIFGAIPAAYQHPIPSALVPSLSTSTAMPCVVHCSNLYSSSSVWHNEALSWHCPVSPSASELWDMQSPLATSLPGAASGATANGHSAAAAAVAGARNGRQQQQQAGMAEGGSGSSTGVPGVYKCAALFPSAATSLKLGRNNLHLFRCVWAVLLL